MREVVNAQTKVMLAIEDKKQQQIAMESALLEATKIKTLADAEAYQKQKVMTADGALDKKLAVYKEVQQYWADAFSKYTGPITPTYVVGSNGGNYNAMQQFMDLNNVRTMKELNLNLGNK